MPRFRDHLQSDLPWIAENGADGFHHYAFATCRQCGASAELAAAFVDWLDEHDGGGLGGAADRYREISSTPRASSSPWPGSQGDRKIDLDGAFEPHGRCLAGGDGFVTARYLAERPSRDGRIAGSRHPGLTKPVIPRPVRPALECRSRTSIGRLRFQKRVRESVRAVKAAVTGADDKVWTWCPFPLPACQGMAPDEHASPRSQLARAKTSTAENLPTAMELA